MALQNSADHKNKLELVSTTTLFRPSSPSAILTYCASDTVSDAPH